MGHIFISYSRKDIEYAHRLQKELLKRGFDIWVDDRIDYGDRWWQAIIRAIRDCDACIVLMSPDAERSEWVEREILLVQREAKPIFPLLLKGREFPLLITTQYTDITDNNLPPEEFYVRLQRVVLPSARAKNISPNPPQQINAVVP